MADMTEPTKRILRSMRIFELSAVTKPAQEGAMAVLMKVAPGETVDEKRVFTAEQRRTAAGSGAAMPDGSFPIENGQDLHNAITAWGRANAADRKAVAKHIKSRAEALGLTDHLPTEGELANAMGTASGKSINDDWYEAFKGDSTMTEAEKLAKAEADLAAVTAEKETLAKMVDMTDAEKLHFVALEAIDAEGAKAFMAMDAAARAEEIKKAENSDPIVYTDSEGTAYHKSEAKAAATAKRADDAAKEVATLKAAAEGATFEKAAGELPFLKGDMATKVAVLRAIEGIADETVRKAAKEMLKASDAGVSAAMHTMGTVEGGLAETDAEAKLKKMAEDKSAAEGISYPKAYDIVARSDEGRKLYKEMVEAKEAKKAA